jgi:hypothetical protein
LIKGIMLDETTSPEVLKWGLGSLNYFDDETRATVFRSLLRREKSANSGDFVLQLGRELGAWGVVVFDDSSRSKVADVVREAVDDPLKFPLLEEVGTRLELFAHIVFGMKERLRGNLTFHSVIPDFSNWLTSLTRQMRALPHKHTHEIAIFTTALHCLDPSQRNGVPVEVARPWWQALLRLMHETIEHSGVDEVHSLFFDQHHGNSNDIATAEEVCGLVEALINRIESGIGDGSLAVDFRDFQKGPHNTWRDSANLAAEWLLTLLDSGQLSRPIHRERAFQLMGRLAAEPLKAENAFIGLHRFEAM